MIVERWNVPDLQLNYLGLFFCPLISQSNSVSYDYDYDITSL